MFWFDKKNEHAIYIDNRKLNVTLCDGRTLVVEPDVIADFRDIPFPDNSFKLVVFDPPHLLKAGEQFWLAQKYGILDCNTWKQDIKAGFNECMRVLDTYGVLIFKWNKDQVKLPEILKVVGQKPLFEDRRAKTHWMTYMKMPS